jgi:hypothetical protein
MMIKMMIKADQADQSSKKGDPRPAASGAVVTKRGKIGGDSFSKSSSKIPKQLSARQSRSQRSLRASEKEVTADSSSPPMAPGPGIIFHRSHRFQHSRDLITVSPLPPSQSVDRYLRKQRPGYATTETVRHHRRRQSSRLGGLIEQRPHAAPYTWRGPAGRLWLMHYYTPLPLA